jgi:hypothetical protein
MPHIDLTYTIETIYQVRRGSNIFIPNCLNEKPA